MRQIMIGFFAFLAASSLQARDLLLTGGKLVDPRTQTVTEQDLAIRDGRIVEGAPASDFRGEVIDITGKWVIPGLRDLHTHSMANVGPRGPVEVLGTAATSRRMLYAGVTGFLDLFNLERFVLPLRDRQRRGKAGAGADIFAAGPCLTAPGGHCTEYGTPTRVLTSPEDARREVEALARKNPDVIKIVYEHVDVALRDKTWRPALPTIDRETMEAAVQAANEHGIPTVFHIRSWQDIDDVVAAGASAVTHLPGFGQVPPGLAERMREQGTFVIPTLSVGDLSFSAHAEMLDRPLPSALTKDEILEAYRQIDPTDEGFRQWQQTMGESQAARFTALATLAEAGVRIAAGTDAGNPGTLLGYSLHHELALMVEQVGLSPWQALASSTTEAGEFLGQSYGLAAGDEGSLVVLDASPIEDIRNTESIHLVIHRGT
ncbi:MAG: amidohydrolase family protein, partial [Acidobacteriota bacterium]